MRSDFFAQLRNFFLFIAFSYFIGYLLGFPLNALLVCSFGYSIYLIYRISQVETWVYRASRGLKNDQEIVGICAGITDAFIALQKRHDREKLKLQGIVNRVQEMTTALNDGVILINRKDNIEWWNRAAGDMFDFQAVDRGHKLTNLIRHPGFSKYFDSMNYEEPLDFDFSREDERYLQFQVQLFGQNERLVIVRDITRMQKLELMRKDFVANVSHELRTPLTVIRGYLETLDASTDAPPKWLKAIGQMLTQSERMTTLINDLIILTKLDTDKVEFDDEPINLFQLAQVVASDVRALTTQHNISIDGDKTLAVKGLKRELQSAISNLVVNAVNYSSANDDIHISIKEVDSEAYIHIEDNGVGIDPKHIPRLTERFYRVDAGRSVLSGGTGLGLAIVKHILIRHNAELLIDSQLGKGSCFTCHFRSSATVVQST